MALAVVFRLLVDGAARPSDEPDLLASGGRAPAALEGLPEGVPGASVNTEGAALDVAARPAAEAPDPRAVAQYRLREAVFAPFRGLGGRFGIAVKDLGTGREVVWNEAFPFQAASLYKLPVMYEVFKLREWGTLTFREEMTIGAADAAMDLGSLPWPVGTRITVGTAVERMVTISDNSSAFMLARKVGTWWINEDALNLGLQQTYIRNDDLATSARDMLRLLELIAQGQAVDAPTSGEMVHLLARQQIRDRIPALLPPDVTVANKTGNWEGAIHDVGIVYTPRATFALALLSDGVTDQDAVNAAMAQAARNVYDLTEDPAYETQPSPPLPPSATLSYAAEPKLPTVRVATAAPTRPAIQSAPSTAAPAAPLATRVITPVQAPVQPVAPVVTAIPAAPTRAPAAPTAEPTAGAERRQEARPTRTPRPDAPRPDAPKPDASKPEAPKPDGAPAGVATPAFKPSAPSILSPGNGNPLITPAAKPQP